MEKWVLAVGYGKEKFNAAQRACLNYGVFIRMAANLTEAVGELAQQNDYLLIAIFSDTSDYLPSLKLLRSLTRAPIIVMKHRYDGAERLPPLKQVRTSTFSGPIPFQKVWQAAGR